MQIGKVWALVTVNFSMAADIQKSNVLIIAPFCEHNPQIVIDHQAPVFRSSCL